jgi:RHH-type rel operon transcriptional repressor/antitoxin RelB
MVKYMADSKVVITLNSKALHNLTQLAAFNKESIEKLAKRLVIDGIECEIENIALSRIIKETDSSDAEMIRSGDVDWDTLLSAEARL